MTGYQLLTDDGGNVFRHLAARTAKREALVQEVDDFAEEIQQKESLEQENGTVEERLEEANKTIEEVEQAKQAENTEEKVGDISAQKPQEEVKNHVEDANQWKKSAVLSLVVRDESQLSNKAIALEHTLEHRQKETGKSSGTRGNIRRIVVCKVFRNPYGLLPTDFIQSCIRL